MSKMITIPKPQKPNLSAIETCNVEKNAKYININFSKFNIKAVNIQSEFNNHFKDQKHFNEVVSSFLGIVLPKISSQTYNQICEGTQEGKALHFHTIDEEHRDVLRNILLEYGYKQTAIDQIFEGNNLFEFSATIGHTYAARVVAHKIDNVFYLLFFDTNHHIYLNRKFVKESLFYETCPVYKDAECAYMPNECFAFSFLDENKLADTFGYSLNPQQ